MTDSDVIARALERLKHPDAFSVITVPFDGQGMTENLTKPLAALIRAVNAGFCHICTSDELLDRSAPPHLPDCALIALCRAITGET